MVKRCEEDLRPENRKDLTQEKIDADVAALKEARENLILKVAAGTGSTVNKGIEGLSNPGNVYENEGPHVNEASWAGSRVLFGSKTYGGQTYKVLNNGLRYDGDRKSVV